MGFPGFQLANIIPCTVDAMLANDAARKRIVNYGNKFAFRKLVQEDSHYTRKIRFERYTVISNLIMTMEKAFAAKRISRSVRRKMIRTLVGRVMLNRVNKGTQEKFIKQFGQDPPGFITISPGKRCNLHCTGCYASSEVRSAEKLDYATVNRIVQEASDLWNAFFTVISGGEPLMWRSGGKGVIDLCRDHPNNYFMMYTNGTLIDEKMAEEMAKTGNLTPAISVEGFEEQTDERRGKGVFKKVLKAMDNLRKNGVPFGISVTATKNNVETILDDRFIDFFFEEQGAVYGWIFQYMPVGRHHTLDLMVTPEQRKWMFEREKEIIHGKRLFMPDFWNGGIFAEGCLAAGRAGGYIHIDWNGSVTPCVFYPYSKDNINEIYANGGDLNDTLKSDLMVGIRKWQRDYGFHKTDTREIGNLIAPCSIRDHYEFTHGHIAETMATPIDADAAEAVEDPLYYKGLVAYDQKFMSLTEREWHTHFLGDEAPVVEVETDVEEQPAGSQATETEVGSVGSRR